MPRTDLSVSVKGVPVKAGFALGSYTAFRQIGDQAMVMGDLVGRAGPGSAPGIGGERHAARQPRGGRDGWRTGDSRFKTGQVGLWTQADSVTAFDGLTIRAKKES